MAYKLKTEATALSPCCLHCADMLKKCDSFEKESGEILYDAYGLPQFLVTVKYLCVSTGNLPTSLNKSVLFMTKYSLIVVSASC